MIKINLKYPRTSPIVCNYTKEKDQYMRLIILGGNNPIDSHLAENTEIYKEANIYAEIINLTEI